MFYVIVQYPISAFLLVLIHGLLLPYVLRDFAYELIIFKTSSKKIIWALGWTNVLPAFVPPSCLVGTSNLGPLKLNSSFGIPWSIFSFLPPIKVKTVTFPYFVFLSFFYYFIMKAFIILFFFVTYLPMYPPFICSSLCSISDVFGSTHHP